MPKRKDPPTEMSSKSIAPGSRHSKLSESESTDTSDTAAAAPESSDAAQKAKERAERWKVLKGRAVTTPLPFRSIYPANQLPSGRKNPPK